LELGPRPRGLVVARSFLWLIAGSLALAAAAGAQTASPLEQFDYILGTQTFGPSYRFTAAPPLVETSRAIAVLGSNAIKFELKPTAGGEKTLTEIARDDPAVSAVLKMPFSYALMWAYPMAAKARLFDPETLGIEYRELYDLTRYLRQSYGEPAKCFFWAIGRSTITSRAAARKSPRRRCSRMSQPG